MEKQFTLEGRSAAEVAALRRAYQSGGIRAVWLWDLMRLKDQEARGKANQYTQYNKVYLYSLLGEKDKAFELVDKMYASHGQGLFVLKMHPRCDNLRSDPRFQALLRRMNFPP
jgi:hypothetical protein